MKHTTVMALERIAKMRLVDAIPNERTHIREMAKRTFCGKPQSHLLTIKMADLVSIHLGHPNECIEEIAVLDTMCRDKVYALVNALAAIL